MVEENKKSTATLLIYCPDQKGIVAKVTEFIDNNNGNVIELDEHVDREEEVFFMRIQWELKNFLIPAEKIGEFFDTQIAAKYRMTWNIHFSDKKPRMAIFVSKMSHCLYDLLSRVQSGEWDVDVPLIISNHEDLKQVAHGFGIPFQVFPITAENKKEQEQKEIELLKKHHISFIVLARYMQVVSEDLINEFPNRIINIHHSFLPAFPGAKPYHSAYKRGVKIIGATSHYVTADLDAGPIIMQDVVNISHKDSVEDLIRKGRDLEKIVLSSAVYHHIQRRTLVYNNKTIVFN
jgi:formyltetrahydrofolate deformylase